MAVSFSGVHPLIRLVGTRLPKIFAKYGVHALVTSAKRSTADQARLYQAYQEGRMPYVVARPGTSRHERGLAIDIVCDDLELLVNVMTALGFRWAGHKDPVHFELPG